MYKKGDKVRLRQDFNWIPPMEEYAGTDVIIHSISGDIFDIENGYYTFSIASIEGYSSDFLSDMDNLAKGDYVLIKSKSADIRDYMDTKRHYLGKTCKITTISSSLASNSGKYIFYLDREAIMMCSNDIERIVAKAYDEKLPNVTALPNTTQTSPEPRKSEQEKLTFKKFKKFNL